MPGTRVHRAGSQPALCTRFALGLALVFLAAGACSAETVDLDVSTSVLRIETTTTSGPSPETTSSAPAPVTTSDAGPLPVMPDVATVVPVRPVRLADDDGSNRAEVTEGHVAAWLTRANEVFAPARLGFSYDPEDGVEDLEDSVLNGWSDAGDPRIADRLLRGNQVASGHPGELVVLFAGGDGVESFASAHTDFIVLGDLGEMVCDAPDLELLAHQIGLHLSVPTTFASTYPTVGAAADALANAGQDPSIFDGDGFADTPPDPGVYAAHRCSGEEVVNVGGLDFELPRANIMSRYQERTTLSLEQMERARWMLGLRRGNEMASPSNVVSDGVAEAQEALVATRGNCGLPSVQQMADQIAFLWSAGDQLMAPSQPGCALDFELAVEAAGSFELVALATRAPGYGAVQFSLNGEALHLEDLYAPTLVASGPIGIGEASLEPPAVVITVEVVGSNAGSAGSSVGIDGFVLRVVD